MPYAKLLDHSKKVNLGDINPKEDGGLTKEEGKVLTEQLGKEMAKLQELLFAARQNSLLIILQGRDTSGKDGAIRNMLQYVNVQSGRVAAFKVPTDEELAHDFLWRIHKQAPGKGEVVIFNRSHYEDVLVAKVHNLVPHHLMKTRYDDINAFEKLLIDNDTIVIKFYLHISKEEQEERLYAREKDPTKSWKLNVGDWTEREVWDEYTKAYELALERCSTEATPWHIVPADRKWYRDLALFETIVETLRPYEKSWRESLEDLGKKATAELNAYRKENSTE